MTEGPKRLLVCGDRNWTDRDLVFSTLDEIKPELIIEGEARGADTMAREWAESRGVPFEAYPAQWDKYGRAAGPIRNKQMLEEGKPDGCLAFHDNIKASKGTKNMLTQAVRAKVWTAVITHGGQNGGRGPA